MAVGSSLCELSVQPIGEGEERARRRRAEGARRLTNLCQTSTSTSAQLSEVLRLFSGKRQRCAFSFLICVQGVVPSGSPTDADHSSF